MEKLNTTIDVRLSNTRRAPSSLTNDIILSLLYFDIFKHPLTANELFNHSSIPGISKEELTASLEELLQKKQIISDNIFFYLPSVSGLARRRTEGSEQAMKFVRKARKISDFIAYFPFVRGIFLSGSVSKGYADKNSDIDYFIVTEPGRLWLARTLLILFKKIFLLNSRKYFCLNYFVDQEHLEIPDKNLFTATELAYLFPIYNEVVHHNLLMRNSWTKNFFPNFIQSAHEFIPEKKRRIKKILEKIFSSSLGERLDDFCLFMTERFWRYKFRKNIRPDSVAIRCKKHVSKFHPQNFQQGILERYEQKISEYESTNKIILRP